MKIRIATVAATCAVAASLLLPESVAADCRMHFFNQYRGAGNTVGAFKVAGGLNFGLGDNDQTVVAADGSYTLSEEFALRFGGGWCSSGGSGTFVLGAQGLYDLWYSEDGRTKLQGAAGFNTSSFSGARTTVVPFQLNVRHVLTPTLDAWGGGELTYNRFGSSGFSASQSNFGLNAGITADLNEQITFRTGLSAHFWSGATQYGLSTSFSYKPE